MIAERVGRAIRKPTVEAMLSYTTNSLGKGWVYALNNALDQTGAVIGPLLMSLVLLLKGDPYPFILLNLFLSMLAAVQAPVIMMSQNRQDVKDRLRGELDFDVNRRAESEIQGLARKLNLLDEKVDDLGNLLRVTRAQ